MLQFFPRLGFRFNVKSQPNDELDRVIESGNTFEFINNSNRLLTRDISDPDLVTIDVDKIAET